MRQGWADIRAEVLRRIAARDWPLGAVIPTEAALALEFGCARATVNRALRDLAAAGVLERRRRAGTRVAALPVRRAVLEIPVIRLQVLARGQVHGFRLLAQRRATPPVPVAARMGSGAKMLYLETLHLADGLPFLFEVRWLNPAVLPDPAPDFAAISANEWLVTHVQFARAEIGFLAEAASPREAEVLAVARGTALLITDRATFGPDQAITLVRLAHAPGYRLQAVL